MLSLHTTSSSFSVCALIKKWGTHTTIPPSISQNVHTPVLLLQGAFLTKNGIRDHYVHYPNLQPVEMSGLPLPARSPVETAVLSEPLSPPVFLRRNHPT